MNLVKTSLLSLASTAMKMLTALAISKALAIYVGPSGLAVVGQFHNFVQLMLTAAKFGLDTGVTKYTAEYSQDADRRTRLFSTALRLCAGSCLIVALTLVAGAKSLSLYFLQTVDFAYVMRLFGVTIGLFVMNSMLLSILNGLQEIRTYIVVNILQSALTLVLTVILIVSLNLEGALIALVTNQSLALFVVLWKLRGHLIIRFTSFRAAFDRVEALRLSKFALMGSVSAIAAPLTNILVRDHITRTIGQAEAGYWQAIWYISSVYLTVVTMTLSVYFLPKLSATIEKGKLRRELLAGYAIIMPTVMVFAFGVYLSRDLLIRIVFTEEFAPMVELFRWMLVGDVIKLASWLVAYLMLAKAMTKSFIVTEVFFSASFVLLSIVLTDNYGLVGVTYAHALNYSMYLFAVAILTQQFWR